MAKIPKSRKPGQTGNWSGQGKNASTFNARQKAGKSKGCALFMIGAIVTFGIIGAGIVELVA
jgi:hypothetical protein